MAAASAAVVVDVDYFAGMLHLALTNECMHHLLLPSLTFVYKKRIKQLDRRIAGI